MRGICSKRSEKWFSSAYQVQPFAVVVRTATMASADFCRPIDAPYDAPSSRQTDRSPRVIHATFLPYTRRIYSSILLDDYWVLKILAFSPGWNCLVCDFCSSGRKFACGFLQIPPHGGHPCRSASGSRHQGPQRTFTSKSPISHHSRSDGACAPRAMPGAPRKNPPYQMIRGIVTLNFNFSTD